MAFETDKKPEAAERKVGILLAVGIFFLPYIFSWFTLRKGHTTFAKIGSFAWLGVVLLVFAGKPSNNAGATAAAGSSPSAASASPAPAASKAPPKPVEVAFHEKAAQCVALAETFGLGTKKTELQLDGMFESMKGQLFQYDVKLSAVEVTFGSLSVQVKCPKSKSLIGSDFILSAEDEFKAQLSQLDEGASLTVCGRFNSYTRFTGLHGDLVALGPCPNATLSSR